MQPRTALLREPLRPILRLEHMLDQVVRLQPTQRLQDGVVVVRGGGDAARRARGRHIDAPSPPARTPTPA
jgi:hypothetical protein|eukprot:COSAG02_NODE_1871_length_10585_cov_11.667366_3_plen_70_part_00